VTWVLLIFLIWVCYRISRAEIRDEDPTAGKKGPSPGPTQSKKRAWSPFMQAYNASPLRKAYLRAVKPKPLPSTVMRRNRRKKNERGQQ
jgi:hypothetical protein